MTAPRKPAPRPPARELTVTIDEGPFAGWSARVRTDFPAGRLADLQGDELRTIIDVLDEIVLEHNLPNGADELAAAMADVSPWDGLIAIATEIFTSIGRLPNR